MKKSVLILLFSAIIGIAKAQVPDWEWAKSGDGNSGEGWQHATDLSENNYLTGFYFGSMTFGSYTLSDFNPQAFLVKYDSSGNVLWARSSLGTIGGNAYGAGVAVDASGYIYITGIVNGGTVFFGPHALTSIGTWDVFLAKYDSSGNNIWVRSAIGSATILYNSISINSAGEIIVSGNYNTTSMIFGTDTLLNSGNEDMFIAKYDTAGNELWARRAGSTGYDNSNGILTDKSGNVYMTGFFSWPSIIFGNDTLINSGGKDFFLVKYDSFGNVIWSTQASGTDNDFGYGLGIDSQNNLCVAGATWSPSITFGFNTLTNSLGGDLFLLKYDSMGNGLWAKDYPATQGGSPYCLALDSQNNIYMSGVMSYFPMHFDSVTLVTLAAQNSDPMFIVKFNPNGVGIWGKTLTSGGDDQNSISIGPSGNIYVGGDYTNVTNLPFIVGSTTLTVNNAAESPFIAKLSYEYSLLAEFIGITRICPGTCTNFTNLSFNATTYQWSFPFATPDTSTDINPTNICYANPGTYDVQLIAFNANGSDTLLLTNYINVFPSPPPQSITQSGDTLFAIAGAPSYQWYFNSNIINGATDYVYVAQASGDYNVVATDANGCEVEAVVFNVIADIPSTVDSGLLTIFPNPVEDKFAMHNSQCMMRSANEISVYNVLGEMVLTVQPHTSGFIPITIVTETSIDVSELTPGLYYIEIVSGGKIFRSKFVKE